ncbi:MAG: hypothetical protein JWL76_1865 [Thermoleophilia bacterium]|nr:hypothetical protein [Thermoleophilia bacterium]
MKPTRKRATRLMAFGPALVMICVTAYVASGASVVGSASAVSTAGVQGTVSTAGSADPDVSSATCAGENAAGGEALGAGWESSLTMTNGCLLTFWTNNGNGATVNYADDYGGTTFFCKDGTPGGTADATRICGTDNQNVDQVPAGGAIANGSDKFGIALTAVSGGGGATNGTGATAAPVATPGVTDAVWWPIDAATRQLCKTTASNTSGTLANCTFKMGGSGEGATQGAGTYYGRALLTITQNP